MVALTCGAFVKKEGISGISRVRERGQGQRGGSRYRSYAEIGDSLRRVRRTLMSHSSGLAASLGRKRKGKWRGVRWLLINVGVRRIWQEMKSIKEGGIRGEGLVTGVKLGRRRKTLTWPDGWGPRMSERKEKECTSSEREVGPWAKTGAGHKGFPGALLFFSFFLFFLFLFSISFITFAFCLQFDSNQFLKFSNIQNNILK
jgi:hypothetical protein